MYWGSIDWSFYDEKYVNFVCCNWKELIVKFNVKVKLMYVLIIFW